MKKLIALIFSIAVLLGGESYATTSAEYFVDDQAIEQTLNTGEQLDIAIKNQAESALDNLMDISNQGTAKIMAGEKTPTVSFILSWVLGWFGAHRIYLGTSAGVIVGYILTGGGCGILWTIDTILLLIELIEEKNFSKYVDNKKFFMFAN